MFLDLEKRLARKAKSDQNLDLKKYTEIAKKHDQEKVTEKFKKSS